jgi:hypothetical protein
VTSLRSIVENNNPSGPNATQANKGAIMADTNWKNDQQQKDKGMPGQSQQPGQGQHGQQPGQGQHGQNQPGQNQPGQGQYDKDKQKKAS